MSDVNISVFQQNIRVPTIEAVLSKPSPFVLAFHPIETIGPTQRNPKSHEKPQRKRIQSQEKKKGPIFEHKAAFNHHEKAFKRNAGFKLRKEYVSLDAILQPEFTFKIFNSICFSSNFRVRSLFTASALMSVFFAFESAF